VHKLPTNGDVTLFLTSGTRSSRDALLMYLAADSSCPGFSLRLEQDVLRTTILRDLASGIRAMGSGRYYALDTLGKLYTTTSVAEAEEIVEGYRTEATELALKHVEIETTHEETGVYVLFNAWSAGVRNLATAVRKQDAAAGVAYGAIVATILWTSLRAGVYLIAPVQNTTDKQNVVTCLANTVRDAFPQRTLRAVIGAPEAIARPEWQRMEGDALTKAGVNGAPSAAGAGRLTAKSSKNSSRTGGNSSGSSINYGGAYSPAAGGSSIVDAGGPQSRRPACNLWAKGHCHYGSTCKFEHCGAAGSDEAKAAVARSRGRSDTGPAKVNRFSGASGGARS
jgi:hypothetical protein